jgi:hypothetical protein
MRATCPADLFPHSNNILVRVQVVYPLIVQFSSASCYLLYFKSKYSPQRLVFKHVQSVVL